MHVSGHMVGVMPDVMLDAMGVMPHAMGMMPHVIYADATRAMPHMPQHHNQSLSTKSHHRSVDVWLRVVLPHRGGRIRPVLASSPHPCGGAQCCSMAPLSTGA